jgi:N-glycosylase/DNA lyase
MRARLDVPSGFSFRRTVASHGWCDLAPFSATPDARAVSTVVAIPHGGARRLTLREEGCAIVVETPGVVDAATRRTLMAAGRRVLALDVDVSEFHAKVSGDPRYRWIAETGTGRLLRSPTAWEDVVKLVLTTNCSWAFTKKMTNVLVERYGEVAPDGAKSFPSPERMAKVKEKEFRGAVRAGYRSPYLVSLSRDVASGACNPGAWDDDPREAALLRKEMVRLPGVGPYVAENLLKLIGRPDGLAIDSAIRAKYSELYHGGRKIKDTTIARRLAPLGRWGALALWFDLWKAWMEEDALRRHP